MRGKRVEKSEALKCVDTQRIYSVRPPTAQKQDPVGTLCVDSTPS